MASGTADGTILPATFVKANTAALAGHYLQAGAGDLPMGISQAATRRPPALGLDDGNAAILGENFRIFDGDTEEPCYLQILGTVAFGDRLKPSTNGKGITVAAGGDVYGARALQPGISGQTIKVKVEFGTYAVS